MKTGLAIFGIVFGALLLLAAIFNWPIVVWGTNPPPDRPTIGTDGRRMPPAVRVVAGLIGAAFVVPGILTVAGVL